MYLGCLCLCPLLHLSSCLHPETLSQLESVVRRCPSVSRQKLFKNPLGLCECVVDICVCVCLCLCVCPTVIICSPHSLTVRTQDSTTQYYSHVCTNHKDAHRGKETRTHSDVHTLSQRRAELFPVFHPPLALGNK